MRKTKEKKSAAMKVLENISGGPLTLGRAIESIRKGEDLSQDACAKKLGVSKSHLCDVEKGRKTVSPERAAKWARVLGYPESVLVRLAIQGELDAAGLKYKVEIARSAIPHPKNGRFTVAIPRPRRSRLLRRRRHPSRADWRFLRAVSELSRSGRYPPPEGSHPR